MADSKENLETDIKNADEAAKLSPKDADTKPQDLASPTSPISPASPTSPASLSTPPRQTLPSSATVERTRPREDTPVRLEPFSIGKPPKTPNFGLFRSKLGTPSSQQKDRMNVDSDSGTPQKNPFAPAGKRQWKKPTEKANFDADITANIGTIKWDSDVEDDL
ncbi:hypothetical protein ABW20_dc0106426 [Dactylellina cionopaga]|nr:hypothetical protein ABW20_dc0106426 [Dactylellina cionopaga]